MQTPDDLVNEREWLPGRLTARLAAVARAVCRAVFVPPPNLTVSEAADKYRILPDTSPAAGQFHTDAIPYLRGIQDALGDPTKPEVVWAKASRVAGTTVGENYILYRILFKRGGIISVWPTVKKFTDWVAEKLDPMIDDSPELRRKIGRQRRSDQPGGRREAGDSLHRKKWPGGWLQGVSAKSVPQLKSAGATVIVFEEPDEYDDTNQGDVIELGRVRVREHGSAAKVYINGSPTIAGSSAVWAQLEASTFNERWVPCPHCGKFQVLRWRDGDGDMQAAGRYWFVWQQHEDGSVVAGTVRCICQHCDFPIEERHKHGMDFAGEWRPRYPDRVDRPGIAEGFHLGALLSPYLTWEQAAIMFTRAAKDPEAMKVFVNTVLGLPFEESESKVDAHFLANRVEPYGEEVEVPHGVATLVAGVDVQGRGAEGGELHAYVYGIGAEEEEWLIAWEIFEGDPHKPEVWRDLAKGVLNRTWRHASGAPMTVAVMAIDAGFAAEHVHRFCDTHARAFAVMGRSGPGRQILTAPGLARSKWRRRGTKQKRPTHVVGIDTLKNDLYSRLQIAEPGPRYIHFPDWIDPVFFEQLTAERLVSRRKGRKVVREWEKLPDRNNEAMDGWNYAHAAFRRFEMDNPKVRSRLAEMAKALSDWSAPKESAENRKAKRKAQHAAAAAANGSWALSGVPRRR